MCFVCVNLQAGWCVPVRGFQEAAERWLPVGTLTKAEAELGVAKATWEQSRNVFTMGLETCEKCVTVQVVNRWRKLLWLCVDILFSVTSWFPTDLWTNRKRRKKRGNRKYNKSPQPAFNLLDLHTSPSKHAEHTQITQWHHAAGLLETTQHETRHQQLNHRGLSVSTACNQTDLTGSKSSSLVLVNYWTLNLRVCETQPALPVRLTTSLAKWMQWNGEEITFRRICHPRREGLKFGWTVFLLQTRCWIC